MGTLTAHCPRLAEHCPHKLPSSCRLTSTPNCCACADERQHSLTYRVYIDGVGYVQRGTRWQSYCWFCKSFWDARVAAAGLSPSDTRIPHDPDQAEFVARWFEFHQGYAVVKGEDGKEERVPLQAEPLKDVDPGHLPRTLEEIQTGRVNTLQNDRSRREATAPTEDASPHVTLEDALDQLLAEADEEDNATPRSTSPVISPALTAQSHIVIAENPSVNARAREDQSRLDNAFAEAEAAVAAAQRVRDRAEARLSNADAELAVARERLRRIRRQQITAGNFARVFGTREDIQSDDYVSPITSMFVRQAQWGRQIAERQRIVREQEQALRNFEEIHQQARLQDPDLTTSHDHHTPSAVAANTQSGTFRTQLIGDSHTFLHTPLASDESTETQQDIETRSQTSTSNVGWDDYLSRIAHLISPTESTELRAMLSTTFASPAEAVRAAGLRNTSLYLQESVYAGLDGDSRPEPKKEEALQFKLECKICLQQVADTACLPCGHLSMCEWCADQWVPTLEQDKTRPRYRGVKCPCCRAKVKSRVKIYVG